MKEIPNSQKHPYARDKFRGTPEIQKIQADLTVFHNRTETIGDPYIKAGENSCSFGKHKSQI